MTKENSFYQYCVQDTVLYMGATEALRRGLAQIIAATQNGFLAYVPHSNLVMLAADTEAEAAALLTHTPAGVDLATVHAAWQVPLVQAALGLREGCNECYAAAYLHTQPLAVPQEVDIRPLNSSHHALVYENYHLADDADYIAELLESGVMLGAFVDGAPAGFIGQHGEGSMGLLEVFPAFQRRGLAAALESSLINRTLAKGQIPFCDVFCDNEASLRLQEKLQLTSSAGHRFWVF